VAVVGQLERGQGGWQNIEGSQATGHDTVDNVTVRKDAWREIAETVGQSLAAVRLWKENERMIGSEACININNKSTTLSKPTKKNLRQ
jgi:hypothetical protein